MILYIYNGDEYEIKIWQKNIQSNDNKIDIKSFFKCSFKW